jgi:hypothetical protein
VGGDSFKLEIAPIAGAAATPATRPDELLDIVFERLVERFDWSIEYYFNHEMHSPHWHAGASALEFGFKDAAGGCDGSQIATMHWFELVASAGWDSLDEEILRPRGYRLLGRPRSPQSILLAGVSCPLTYVGSDLVAVEAGKPVVVPEDDEGPWWYAKDEDVELPPWAELEEKERAAVQHAALTGHCDCSVCGELRPYLLAGRPVSFSLLPGAEILFFHPPEIDIAAAAARVERAFHLLDEPHAGAMVDHAARALAPLAAARATEPLHLPTEVAVLRDWLEEHGAAISSYELIGMVSRRVSARA